MPVLSLPEAEELCGSALVRCRTSPHNAALVAHALVRAEACARAAAAAGLPDHIQVAGLGHDSARARAAILSDVCEAVIAALYLDGGMKAARKSSWLR